MSENSNVVIINSWIKDDVLDPQSKALLATIERFSLPSIKEARLGKQFLLKIDSPLTPKLLDEISWLVTNFLINPVIEDYSIEVKSES